MTAPTTGPGAGPSRARADLWWLPVGAGGHVVVRTSRWWELARARHEHRAPRPLFHAALEVTDGRDRYVVEMAPAWTQRSRDRGVVASGPVGLRGADACPLLRYEVRRWKDGTIDDRRWAVASPVSFPLSADDARTLLAHVADVPRHVWGRDVYGTGDMWNSNSLVSWLLASAAIDPAAVTPPAGGLAPGWESGIAAARGG